LQQAVAVVEERGLILIVVDLVVVLTVILETLLVHLPKHPL
jgi:hypothetical protein